MAPLTNQPPPTLTVTMGIPGSGKTTWATHIAQRTGALLLTTDLLRTEGANLTDHLQSIAHHAQTTLEAGQPVIVDACNIHTQMRRRWLRIGLVTDSRCVLAIINTPHLDAIKRNKLRPTNQQVPGSRMADYVRRWDAAVRLTTAERWSDQQWINPTSLLNPTRNW